MGLVRREDIPRLARVVRELTGNQILEKNYSMLESRMNTHVMKLQMQSMDEYWEYYKAHEAQERDCLQSLMTTHHTFFFREYVHFELLENWIEQNAGRLKERFEKSKTKVRVWSAACSRGQEVYSLAMFLDRLLLKGRGIDYEIVGTDIDQESVAYAKNGVYPIAEVNTIPRDFLNGYWKRGTGAIEKFAAVHPTLKSRTRFEPLNLLTVPTWSERAPFDVVFCRNVFIYFSQDSVQKIALSLQEKIYDDGLFISGLSEPLRFPAWKLASLGNSAYQKSSIARGAYPAALLVAKTSPSLRSAPSVGSPQAPIASPAASQPVAAQLVPSQLQKYKVLCVDDSPTIQTLMKKLFSQDPLCAGVGVAGNGKLAREELDRNSYDLITLDIHMPEVNGIEFLERLYKKQSDPPVIMVSSVNRIDLELATKSLSLGAFDYVEKPALNNLDKSRDELLTKVKMALRSKVRGVEEKAGSFDVSIGQTIVIPDASQCLRVVLTSSSRMDALKYVVMGQKSEYRSPPLLILFEDAISPRIEAEILLWTNRKLVQLRQANQILKPNHVYTASCGILSEILTSSQFKSASVQILQLPSYKTEGLKKISSLQVLFDEGIVTKASEFERSQGLKISEVTPTTSFASLSVEFFANLRKAAA